MYLINIPLPPSVEINGIHCNIVVVMAITRVLVLRMSCKPIHLAGSTTSSASFCYCSSMSNGVRLYHNSKANLINGDDDRVSQKVERKGVVALKASVAASDHIVPSASASQSQSVLTTTTVNSIKQWNFQPQMLIEKAIIDCRFFTLFAVLGSLIGSVLCFLEGCFLVIESYVQYFHILSKRLDQGHVVQLLIEAIDMFLAGTAMVMFGVGLYVMFVGSKNYDEEEKETRRSRSNLLGLFSMKATPRWAGMESIAQAKSKIGHAVMMILQVGILDKFKDIPLVTGFDLACFAASVLTSSACIFLLSRLHR